MLSRLPISSNKSRKKFNKTLKWDKTTILSFVSLKKLIKTIYNNLPNAILKWEQSLWILKIVRQINLINLD